MINDNGQLVNTEPTDGGGDFGTIGLPTGSYALYFFSPGGPYPSQYYPGTPDPTKATWVQVTAPAVTTLPPVVLAVGTQFKGRVTAADGGGGLAGIYVSVWEAGAWPAYGETDATGTYTTTGVVPGPCKLQFWSQGGPYIAQYYNDQSSLADAAVVLATGPGIEAGYNAVLARGGQITGTLKAADTGQPISSYVQVMVLDGSGDLVTSQLASGGSYATEGLPDGTYRVLFTMGGGSTPSPYAAQFYNKETTLAAADSVEVAGHNLVPNIDASLSVGGQIQGQVVAADTGLPVVSVEYGVEGYDVYDAAGTLVDFGNTNAAGFLRTDGLPTGSYRLKLESLTLLTRSGAKTYPDQYYNNKANLATADVIAVTAVQVDRHWQSWDAPLPLSPAIEEIARQANRI